MVEAPRITRPRLEVDKARRQPSWRLGSGRGPGSPDAEHRDGERATNAGRPADAISRGVELGYRVMDEYMRQGSRLARTFDAGALGPNIAQGDVRELGERMFQYATEAMSIWLELLGMTTAGAATQPAPDARRADFAKRERTSTPGASEARVAPASRPPTAAPTVAIAVDSARPVEVALRLHDPAASHPLRVQALRAEPGEPRLSDVRIEADASGQPERLFIRVDESVPEGTYYGLIVDETTGLPAGTLSVTVSRSHIR